jgi:hypothetical protein
MPERLLHPAWLQALLKAARPKVEWSVRAATSTPWLNIDWKAAAASPLPSDSRV